METTMKNDHKTALKNKIEDRLKDISAQRQKIYNMRWRDSKYLPAFKEFFKIQLKRLKDKKRKLEAEKKEIQAWLLLENFSENTESKEEK
jgi:hypothetical protein